LQRTVRLIPSGWQFPEITAACLVLESQTFQTERFRETRWMQTREIMVNGKPAGRVDVCYLEERPASQEGPFLTEERQLLNAIAERLGRIVERRRTEQALRESEARFRELFENSPDAVFVEDVTGTVLDANPAAGRLHGLSREALVGMNVLDLVPPELRDEVRVRFPQWFTDGLTATEGLSYRADGRPVTVDISGTSIRYRGQPAVLLHVRDITERKAAERARADHLARLHLLVDVSKEVLAATSKQELMQNIVEAARKITGAKLGVCGHGYRDGTFEVQAAARADQMPPCPPGESFRIEHGGVHLELIHGRNTIRYTDEQLRAHPQWWGLPAEHAPLRGLLGARLVGRDVQSNGVILVSDKGNGEFTSEDEALLGQLAALCSVGMQHLEATERAEQRAEQLAKVFSAMTDGVMILNAEGVTVDANGAFVEAFGFNPISQTSEAIIRRLSLRRANGTSLPLKQMPSHRALRGEIALEKHLAFTGADGKRRTIMASAAPLHGRGQVTGAVVVWHDVTEREALLQSVAKARDELELRVSERTAELEQTVTLLKESEERFRSLFDKHDAIMLLLDSASGQIVDANPAAAKFYDCAREHLRTLNVRDLGFTPPRATPSKQPQAWMHSRERFETPTRLSAGVTRTLEVYSSPISLQRRPVLFAIMHDVTERKLLERQIVEISEQERQRIGRDLHDSLGGQLTGLALLTKALAQMLARQRLSQAPMAAEIVDHLNKAVDMTRSISHGLCPIEPGEQGLLNGLHEFVMGIRQRTGVACRFRVKGRVAIPDAVVASHLYRIVEEAVQNALRHAKPQRIEIRLRRVRAGLLLTIWNDGRPLPATADVNKGLGLRTMRYRANLVGSDLELRRETGGATVVSCLVPDRDKPQWQSSVSPRSRQPKSAKRVLRVTRSRSRKKA
jgi:PAS domain S-box-containing protein